MATVAPVQRVSQSDTPIDAIASLPPNLAIMRMENDNIMALAASHPRSIAKMRASLEEQLKEFPKQAEKLIFAKPCGWQMDECKKCGAKLKRDNKKEPPKACFRCRSTDIKLGGEKFARGLSIRAAEMLAESYGYNRIRSWVEIIDRDTVKVCATFTDYQNGRSWTDEGIQSRFFTTWDKKTERYPDDRFNDVVVRAKISKVVREVVNRSVSASLKAWLFDECENIIDQNLDDATIDKMLQKFAGKDVTEEMIEGLIGRPRAFGWTLDNKKTLLGVWNALEAGDMTIAELFPDGEKDPSGNESGDPKKPLVTPPTPTASALNNPNLAGKKVPEAPKVDAAKQLNQCNFIRFKIESAPTLEEVDNLVGFADECVKKGDISAEHLQSLQPIIAKRKEELAPSQEVEKKDPEPEKQVEETVAPAAPTDDQIKAWKEYSGRIDECKNLLELEFLEADIKDAASKGTIHADQVGSLRPLIDLRKKDLARS